ncbi:putative F420-dependent oxidoreductase [Haloactinospora alba]|uniref:Putative F420-dependent oxidoreductase n=1 Tax=Haloactinospora alba TaxID=405555 RepID=A0A543NJS7_9ACTN|nr:TIGR03621 family F420-dependent LLM class oxidoreductase [Haloactinospora alba]TQN32121.1 putative F420-dependent oxidoreductase [Haloactinospora alba]
MTTTRDFRFGVNLQGVDPADTAEYAREAESMGFDVVHTSDHLGQASPFASLGAAAAATTRIRLGTLVVNNEFWNPAVLAREAATIDRLSGGRLELGLGCGHMRSEFDDAGIPWQPHAQRVRRLRDSIAELDRLFAGGQEPLPTQTPRPPVLVGAHGERTLALAAQHADIVGYAGLSQIRGERMGTFRVAGPEETRRRVEFVHRQAGARAERIESNVLVQHVGITDDAEKRAAELAQQYGAPGIDIAADVLENPFVLVGTADEVAAELRANRERFGFSYVTTHGPFRDALAEVIPRLRERENETPGGLR